MTVDDSHSLAAAAAVGFAGAELVVVVDDAAMCLAAASGPDAHFGADAVSRTADTLR